MVNVAVVPAARNCAGPVTAMVGAAVVMVVPADTPEPVAVPVGLFRYCTTAVVIGSTKSGIATLAGNCSV